MTDVKTDCPHCGAKMVEYTHTFNAGLAAGLYKLAVNGGKRNLQEINLTKNEYTNFQKLKYWGLVRRSGEGGEWEVTYSGKRFLFEDECIMSQAVTYRGELVRYAGQWIRLTDELDPNYRTSEEYALEAEKHSRAPIPLAQKEMF